MINEDVAKEMLEKFDGYDSGDPGTTESPSVWLFGIEPGYSKADQVRDLNANVLKDQDYSLATQLQWRYNQNAFKLLAAMNGYEVEQYRKFAEKAQPFVRGCSGYFKANIYPYACNNVGEWHEYAAKETGFLDKKSYLQWCQENRLPEIKKWIDKCQPKLFIGVGNTHRDRFSLAVFGRIVDFDVHQFAVNNHGKKIYYSSADGIKLVVIPHLSGGRNGLNSDDSLQKAGSFIAGL